MNINCGPKTCCKNREIACKITFLKFTSGREKVHWNAGGVASRTNTKKWTKIAQGMDCGDY